MLALVGIELLVEDLVKISPEASLAGVAVAFAIGIALSVRADRRLREIEDQPEDRIQAQ